MYKCTWIHLHVLVKLEQTKILVFIRCKMNGRCITKFIFFENVIANTVYNSILRNYTDKIVKNLKI